MKRIVFMLMCVCCVSITQAGPDDIRGFNAEDPEFWYIPGDNWQDVEDQDALGGIYITPIENGTTHDTDHDRYYRFDLPAGIYNCYVRVYIPDDAPGYYDNDSWFHSETLAGDSPMVQYNHMADDVDIDGVSVQRQQIVLILEQDK